MSGTSLDGLDLALVTFELNQAGWSFKMQKAICVPYPAKLTNALEQGIHMDAAQLTALDQQLGAFIGEQINMHFQEESMDFIASHGHTIFHQPQKGITLQIGCGRKIHEQTGTPVIYDFRSQDIQLDGQGAPLVPIGDELLFGAHAACLNLGGIANVSFRKNQKRLAFDVMPFNMALNYLAKLTGKAFDENGKLAQSGQQNHGLLERLNGLTYYEKEIPKSLGIEDFHRDWLSLIADDNISIQDRLHTYVLHAAKQIGLALNQHLSKEESVLITGGGTYHLFFIEALRQTFHGSVSIPTASLIDYKEALIFAFMGVLRSKGKNNCLASVTGATRDSCAGKMVGFS